MSSNNNNKKWVSYYIKERNTYTRSTYMHIYKNAGTNTPIHANQAYLPSLCTPFDPCKCFQLHSHSHTSSSIMLDKNLWLLGFFFISIHFRENVCMLSVCQPKLIMLIWIDRNRNGFFLTTSHKDIMSEKKCLQSIRLTIFHF